MQDATPEEWEARLGEQLRRARLQADLGQPELAAAANVSVGALRGLERGQGSTLKTLVRVVLALHREDWLAELEPKPAVDPLEYFRTGERDRERQRASRRRTAG